MQVIFRKFAGTSYIRFLYFPHPVEVHQHYPSRRLKLKICLHMTNLYKAFSTTLLSLFVLAGMQSLHAQSVFTVTTTADAGAGSLRQAILDANADPDSSIIQFDLGAGAGPYVISLATNLPAITSPLFINGYSQDGATPGPIASRVIAVEIDGSGIAAVPGEDVLTIISDNVAIAGLAIYSCPSYAISIGPGRTGIHIWGNFIGTDATGTAAGLGNEGGIISALGANPGGENNYITVGTNGDGVDDANEGNLIVASNGFGTSGFGVVFWRTQNSIIAGNIIGLDKNGEAAANFGHSRDGILVTVGAANCVIGTNGDGVSDDLEGNLIGQNGENGITNAGLSPNNIIAGNRIGVDANDNPAGNGLFGISVLNSSDVRIGTNGDGTSDDLEVNVIGSNGSGGIAIITEDFFGFNANSSSNTIAGNYIGTNANSDALGNNGPGILLRSALVGADVTNNIIGSNFDGNGDEAEGNVIANNTKGIVIQQVAGVTTANKISRNSIYNNAQLGIDIDDDGVTVNDDGDLDDGANDLLNAPVLVSTQIQGGNLTVTGFTRPGSVVEFYIADAGTNPDPLPGGFTKNFGEGQVYLFRGQDDATLDGIADDDLTTGVYEGSMEGTGAGGTRTENRFSFSIPLSSLPTTVGAGTRITALAYFNASGPGSTSEFSGNVNASALPVTLTSFKGRLNGGKAELTWTTTDEKDNSHFDIERSDNGQAYTKVGSVKGNGGISNTYYFTDNGPLPSVIFYRLKQVDLDGRATYSNTLVLRNNLGTITAKVSPSPFQGFINVTYQLTKEENIRIRLIDPLGRIVKTYSTRGGAGVNTINLDGLDHLPKGIYMIELLGESVMFRQKLVK